MIRLLPLVAGFAMASTASSAGILSNSDDGIIVLDQDRITCTLRQTADGLVDSCAPTDTNGITTIANPITCTLRQTPEGLVDSCAPTDTSGVTTIPNPITCTLRQTPEGLVDSCAPTDTSGVTTIPNPITCTLRQTPEGLVDSCAPTDTNEVITIANPITCTLSITPSGIVDVCAPEPDLEVNDRVSIWDEIAKNPTPQTPIACTGWYSPDGDRNCLYDDGSRVGVSPINNPITCTLRQTPDGLVDSCAPTNGHNQVPAPGGLLLILAALGMAVRKKFAAA